MKKKSSKLFLIEANEAEGEKRIETDESESDHGNTCAARNCYRCDSEREEERRER